MITKKELLRGTLKELEDYFYKDLGLVSRNKMDYTNKRIQNYELDDFRNAKDQLKCISEDEKRLGTVAYMTSEFIDNCGNTPFSSNGLEEVHPVIKLGIELVYVFIVDEDLEEKIKE